MRARAQDKGIVILLGTEHETLDGLQSYLTDSGFTTRCLHSVEEFCSAVLPETIAAAVCFVDDFSTGQVRAALDTAATKRTKARLRVVVVTSDAPALLRAAPRDMSLVVLPKPPFGWAIADALRAPPGGEGALE